MAGMVSVIGVPSSAGSYAAGQDQAPGALRAAGLFAALAAAGVDARDAGDLPEQVWAPDRANRRAQNSEQVVASLTGLTDRVAELLAEGSQVLVLGGNCTVALGAMAGMRRVGWQRTGLLYVDRHFDLNTPESTIDGALDWMGLAHGLDLDGCVDALAGAFGPRPLLQPGQIAFLGTDPERSTEWERARLAELDLAVTAQADLLADPAAAASTALRALPNGPLTVHVDVDVLDFTDAPLAENTDGRNIGPTLDQLGAALAVAVADPRWRVLTIGELNPTRAAGDPDAIPRFVGLLASSLAGAARPAGTGARGPGGA